MADASSCATRAATRPAYAPFCALAIVEELSGLDTGVDDPFLEVFQGMAGQDLTPHQLAAIETVQRIHAL